MTTDTPPIITDVEINLPHNWVPRDYQGNLWRALEHGTKRAVAVWHRRSGKDLTFINWTATQAFERVGLYWHILPTYAQGRKIVWEGKTKDGTPFLDAFPEELIINKRNDEMSLTLQGGSMWQVIGTDNVDRLVGTNPVGCVFSEYPLQNPRAWDFIRPILAENEGWAVFAYTPRGRNHGHRMYQMAMKNPKWFCEKLTVDDTHAITQEAIQDERDSGMPEELIRQEFQCSFDAPLVGSYYGDLMMKMMDEGRLGQVPWDPNRPVITAWDLGFRDSTAIWFLQMDPAGPVRAIDFYFAAGKDVAHYAKVISQKEYTYIDHIAPHDATATHVTGTSAVKQFKELGIKMRVIQKHAINDGIQAVRALLPRMYIDEVKCQYGLDALREYRKKQVEGLFDPEGGAVYADAPYHDWTSDPADALRTAAMGLRASYKKREKILSSWRAPA